MKMHPKPMARHTKAVEPVQINPRFVTAIHLEPYHIQVVHAEGRTQVLTMTRDECLKLFTSLGFMLRFDETNANALDPSVARGFIKTLKTIVGPGTMFGSMTGGTRVEFDSATESDNPNVAEYRANRAYLTGTTEGLNASEATDMMQSYGSAVARCRGRADWYVARLSPKPVQPGQEPFALTNNEFRFLKARGFFDAT